MSATQVVGPSGVLVGSIALIGFGIDSAIEGFASAIIVAQGTNPTQI